MGKSGGDTQTVQNKLPAYAEPYAQKGLRWAKNILQTPYEAYGGQRFADFNQDQLQGLDMTRQRALAGSPVTNAAKSNLEATLRGDYLNPQSNPYLQNTVNQAMGDVQSRVNAQFSGNNFGGSAHQEWLQQNLMDTAMPYYMQNYGDERNRQMQANLFAPQMAESDYADLSRLLGVGDVLQGQQQQGLDYLYDQWLQQQNYPRQQLQDFMSLVYGNPGREQVAPNPYQQNRAASAIGGASAGAGLGGALGSALAGGAEGSMLGPWGTAIGAGVGLLGGLLW